MIDLRPAMPDDWVRLVELGQTCFTETFGSLYNPEDLADYLAHDYDDRILESSALSH
jgi:hypothetical protein